MSHNWNILIRILPGIECHILPTLTKVLVNVFAWVVRCPFSTEHVHVFRKAMGVVSSLAVLGVVVKVFDDDWRPAFRVPSLINSIPSITDLPPTIPLLAEAIFWSGRWSGQPVLVIVSH